MGDVQLAAEAAVLAAPIFDRWQWGWWSSIEEGLIVPNAELIAQRLQEMITTARVTNYCASGRFVVEVDDGEISISVEVANDRAAS